jgi:hypothetical protein
MERRRPSALQRPATPAIGHTIHIAITALIPGLVLWGGLIVEFRRFDLQDGPTRPDRRR